MAMTHMRPDHARRACLCAYVYKGDPTFLIVPGRWMRLLATGPDVLPIIAESSLFNRTVHDNIKRVFSSAACCLFGGV